MAKKPVIAITSILKPVDDTRNYEKIAHSLDKKGKYDIYIFGHYVSNLPPASKNISFYPIFKFKRLSLKRILAPWKIYIYLIKVKPHIIVVNTHELLGVIVLYKILFGSKILYDVQENYYRNILATNTFPKGIRHAIAWYVRLKEKLTSRFIDHFLLAEKCYEEELQFINSRYNILENKFLEIEPIIKRDKPNLNKTHFVYSGTIAEVYGIFEAISFIDKLIECIDLSFTIIGFCSHDSTFKKLKETASNKSYINIIGGDRLVPHNQIVKEIESADFALLPYRLNAYYSQRIPTKLYEGLALNTPMIIRRNPHWEPIFNSIDAFLFSDFNTIDQSFIDQLKTQQFFLKKNKIKPFWNFDSEKLITIVNELL